MILTVVDRSFQYWVVVEKLSADIEPDEEELACKSCFLTQSFVFRETGLPPLSFLGSHSLSFSAFLLM